MATAIVPLAALIVTLIALKFYPLDARRMAEIKESARTG